MIVCLRIRRLEVEVEIGEIKDAVEDALKIKEVQIWTFEICERKKRVWKDTSHLMEH